MSEDRLSFEQYEQFCASTAIYPKGASLYCPLGLAGEVAEFLEKFNKFVPFDYTEANEKFHYAVKPIIEYGKIAEKLKKKIRDQSCEPSAPVAEISQEEKKAMAFEISDCLWYISRISNQLGFTLEEVARINMEKLQSRKDRGVLGGSGDNR